MDHINEHRLDRAGVIFWRVAGVLALLGAAGGMAVAIWG